MNKIFMRPNLMSRHFKVGGLLKGKKRIAYGSARIYTDRRIFSKVLNWWHPCQSQTGVKICEFKG